MCSVLITLWLQGILWSYSVPVTSHLFACTHTQDWFSGRLKQVVFDMTSEERSPGSPQDTSVMSSERVLTVSEDLDLLE